MTPGHAATPSGEPAATESRGIPVLAQLIAESSPAATAEPAAASDKAEQPSEEAGKQKDTKSEATGAGDSKPAGKAPVDDKRPYAEAAVKHYNRGVELYQSGFLNQAISEYRSAIDADPRMEESYSNLGLIYVAQRNYAKAIDAFNKALALKPGRPTTLNGLGAVLYARGKVAEAMKTWKEAIANDPNFASAYYNMGNAYETSKDDQAALDSYGKAIKINSRMADAFYRAGSLLNKDNHPAQAQLLLKRSLDLAPDADFSRDAKKQLDTLNGELSGGTDEPEVQMNVLPPMSEGQPAGKDDAGSLKPEK